MSKAERLLALDAALAAAEDCLPPSMRGHAANLQQFLGDVLEEVIPVWGDFLHLQKFSVRRLADCPEAFGCE